MLHNLPQRYSTQPNLSTPGTAQTPRQSKLQPTSQGSTMDACTRENGLYVQNAHNLSIEQLGLCDVVFASDTSPLPRDGQGKQQRTAHNQICLPPVAATSAAGSSANFQRTQLAAAAGMQQLADTAMPSSSRIVLCQITQPEQLHFFRAAARGREMHLLASSALHMP
jgi:hypothetical protein